MIVNLLRSKAICTKGGLRPQGPTPLVGDTCSPTVPFIGAVRRCTWHKVRRCNYTINCNYGHSPAHYRVRNPFPTARSAGGSLPPHTGIEPLGSDSSKAHTQFHLLLLLLLLNETIFSFAFLFSKCGFHIK